MCKPMVARTAGDEPVQWSSDGDTGMKRWSNAVLFHPADKSRHPCPFLASASVLRWIFFSLGQCIALRSFSTECIPEFVQKVLHCESGWNASAWKDPPKNPLSLDNWLRHEIGLCNLDPLLHGISCCLIHWSCEIKLWSSTYDLPAKQKPGWIWSKMIAVIKWIHIFGPPSTGLF